MGLLSVAALPCVALWSADSNLGRFFCTGTAQLLSMGGEGDWTAPQGLEIAALLNGNLGEFRVPTTCELEQL